MTTLSQTGGFTLAQMIEGVAEDLKTARAKAPTDPVMLFQGCELELAVTVKAGTGGKFRFWVVDASAEVSGELISKVKLTFGPPEIAWGRVASTEDTTGPSPTTILGDQENDDTR